MASCCRDLSGERNIAIAICYITVLVYVAVMAFVAACFGVKFPDTLLTIWLQAAGITCLLDAAMAQPAVILLRGFYLDLRWLCRPRGVKLAKMQEKLEAKKRLVQPGKSGREEQRQRVI